MVHKKKLGTSSKNFDTSALLCFEHYSILTFEPFTFYVYFPRYMYAFVAKNKQAMYIVL